MAPLFWLGLLLLATVDSSFGRRPFPFPFPRDPVPVDCLVTYTSWSECSVTCGPGTQRRWGRISRRSRNGGKPCGPLEQERPCQNQNLCDEPEPIDCQVWFGEWSECSKRCGTGLQWRRGLIEVEPANGGKECPPLEEEQSCNEHNCDMPRQDCKVEYSDWSQCSASCGGGFKWRRGRVVVPAKNGGNRCPPLEQEISCNDFLQCTEPNQDCKFSYSQWSQCSKPCGGGSHLRRAVIEQQSSGNGRPCPKPEDLEQQRSCNNHGCTTAPVDCVVKYSSWTTCSKPCGGGISRRWGRVIVKPDNGGAPCKPLEQERKCNEQLCDRPVINCEVKFSEWSECSSPCGGGKQQRWGRIVKQPSNGGSLCPELEQERDCNEEPCLTVVNCQVWFPEWSQCSQSCGGGFQWRRGLIEVEPENGGTPCPPLEEEQPCNNHDCSVEDRDCKVSYSEWGECSQPCGQGFQWRRGVIEVEAKGNGRRCPSENELEQEQSCNDFECEPRQPIDCKVKYTDWSECSAPCGGGVSRRWGRVVQKQANGGAPCPPLEQERACNENLCTPNPVDCQVLHTEWTQCSASCGGGVSRRWGRVIRKAENGGAPCGPLEEERNCNEDINCIPAVVDCIVQYSGWSRCTKRCGGGTRQRWGRIVVEPSKGGAPCGPLEEEQECNTKPCRPVKRFRQRFRRRISRRRRPLPRRPLPKVPKISLDCTRLEDGNHPDPRKKCSNTFISCTNGWGAELKCPEKMFYNKEIDECDIHAYVPACSGNSRPPVSTLPPQLPPKRKPDPEFPCTRRADGEYQDPKSKCSRKWFSCLNGYTTKRTCQNDMYYDIETKSCQQWINVFSCSGKVPAKTTPPPRDQATLPPVPIDCKQLPDGVHPDPFKKCSRNFYQCTNGNGHLATCPGDTYFNPKEKACDSFSNVFPCSGRRPQRTTTRPQIPTRPTVVYPFKCTGKRDGIYAAGRCEPFYWTCSGGVTNKIKCGENLYYDVREEICEQKKHILKCGGKPRTTVALLPTTPLPPVPFDCTLREDKNYPAGKCKQFYYSCSGTVARRMECSESTFYDTELDECNKRRFIPECGGRRPPKPVPQVFIPPPVKPKGPFKPSFKPYGPFRPRPQPRPQPSGPQPRRRPAPQPRPRPSGPQPRPAPQPRPRPPTLRFPRPQPRPKPFAPRRRPRPQLRRRRPQPAKPQPRSQKPRRGPTRSQLTRAFRYRST